MSLAPRNQRMRLHSTLSAFHQGLDVVSTGNSYRVSSVPANRCGTLNTEKRQEQSFLFLINKQVPGEDRDFSSRREKRHHLEDIGIGLLHRARGIAHI